MTPSFAHRLASAMSKRGLTQVVFAQSIGVTQGAVSGWLNGVVPKLDKLKPIATALQVPTDYFINDTFDESSITPLTPRVARGETRFPAITRHARQLGVNRTQLWFVLTNQRQSADILRRYKALLTQEGREIPHELVQRAA